MCSCSHRRKSRASPADFAHKFHGRYRFVSDASGRLRGVQRSISLRTQLLMWQLGIVLFVVTATMATAIAVQWHQLRDAYVDRALGIAHAVAELPNVRESFEHRDPEHSIQPVAELIRKASGMTYVVVTDAEGIRYSHPNPERIGERVSTDPSVALSGKVFTGRETGTLGDTWRAKVPVYDERGGVMGQVSVGILDSELRHDMLESTPWQAAVTVLVAAVSGIGAILTARIFRRRTLGLEPEQIAGLLEGREAILHGSRDGIIAVDTTGRIVLVNDAATDLLALDKPGDLIGASAALALNPSLTAQLLRADGEERLQLLGERQIVVRADPVAHQDQPAGTVLNLRDHTELHKTLIELEGAQSTTERLRTQTHEFQNQLHVINGLLQLGDVEAAQDFVHRLSHGGELPRLDAPDDIDPELGALLLVKNGEAGERGIEFEHAALEVWPSSAETTTKTRDDLLTIVGNLLDNALEAAQDDGTVRLSLQRNAPDLRIIVEDSGQGVPVEMRRQIFVPGVTTKATGDARGFGLSLVESIATRLGGEVEVTPSALGGAAFTVTVQVPLRHGDAARSAADARGQEAGAFQ